MPLSPLKFRVRGSASEPYKLIAEGSGDQFRMLCSCPAGSKGGRFCKHVAALLMGDITNLATPSDDVAVLQQRAAGSQLATRALLQPLPPAPPPAIEATLDALAERIRTEIDGPDMAVILEGRDGDDTRSLAIVARFKNGKPKKSALLAIAYSRLTSYGLAMEDGTTQSVFYPSARPWRMDQQGQQPRTYTTFESAARAFDERARMAR